jgi:protein-tyrosine phosphatase
MAEFVMKNLVNAAGLADRFEIASAATSAEELGNPVYPSARRELARHGIGCAGHTARRICREDYNRYDYLVGMDRANLGNMRRVWNGDPEGKVHALLEFAGRGGEDVADPWYTGDFAATWRDVLDGCRGLLARLEKER